jgi:GNAT superfamily N-acetyltransferase
MKDSDVGTVASLLRVLSEQYILHESSAEARSSFLHENSEVGLRSFMAAGLVYHVAEQDGKLLGFIGMREHKHLFHMFVDEQYQRQGIAKALWAVARQDAMDAGNPGVFTVNSSNYALPVYQALGFVATAPVQRKNGLFYNPMQFDGSHCD